MIRLFRKLPIAVEAVQWVPETTDEITQWTATEDAPLNDAGQSMGFQVDDNAALLYVAVHNGWMNIYPGTWVIKDGKGFSALEDKVFKNTYQEIERIE